ncbi:MAG: prolyl oligopeptidase family serine peptidase [Lewinellaceae bacterium]|nr:prolyl oligopeptidase family serine peptidase [Lewinellaceae bacterium]
MYQSICSVVVALFFVVTTIAQPATNLSSLSIDEIMQGEKFVGYLPENISWSDDSHSVYFSWNPQGDTLRSQWQVEIKAGKAGEPVKLTNEEIKSLTSEGVYNKARTKKVYSKNGDLFLLDFSEPTLLQITNTLDNEGSPIFSGDERKIIFQKDNNLFAWDMATGATEQLTDFKKGQGKKDKKKLLQDEWLERQQLELFEVLADRKALREAEKKRDKDWKPQRPKAYFFGEKRLSGLAISPDLRFVTFQMTVEAEGRQTDVPNYVTESGQVEELKSRPKVGSPQDEMEMGIYDRQLDSIYLVDPTQIDGIYDKPAFLKEYHRDSMPYEERYKHPRPVVFQGPVFSDDGKAVIVIRALDNKDRWLALLNLPTGQLKLLDRQHDDAWIGGPGISGWNYSAGNIGWLADNRHVWFQSEKSGYSHLCTVQVETGEKKALTSGRYEILDAFLSNDRKYFYITSNKETPFEQHFYKMPVEGGAMEKITSLPGSHQVSLSPDEKWLAIRYSYSNKPWELYLMPNQAGAAMIQLTSSTKPGFQKYNWRDPELIWFKASDGAEVPARLYRPSASRRNGAAVVFVHGAGYLQNVHRWWSNYYREFMFHNFLADNGFTVLDIDYRGSSGYGRDWRTAIYRHMGGKDLSDQVDGAKYLVENQGIDANRIGIYGGSYGGFITLMAMFTSPGTFKSGAALRSVTDWAHYNHDYTSNILNTPVEDSLAYRQSSPIYFADGLKGNLLILHGMIDTNVEFQDVVRLAQRLIELKKENWEFAVFPLEDHGFVEPGSWADEYRRIYGLFYRTLLK